MTTAQKEAQQEIEEHYSKEELAKDRKELSAQIAEDFQKLDDARKQHSKLTTLLDGNKLCNTELDDVAGYLSLLLEAIARATYGHK